MPRNPRRCRGHGNTGRAASANLSGQVRVPVHRAFVGGVPGRTPAVTRPRWSGGSSDLEKGLDLAHQNDHPPRRRGGHRRRDRSRRRHRRRRGTRSGHADRRRGHQRRARRRDRHRRRAARPDRRGRRPEPRRDDRVRLLVEDLAVRLPDGADPVGSGLGDEPHRGLAGQAPGAQQHLGYHDRARPVPRLPHPARAGEQCPDDLRGRQLEPHRRRLRRHSARPPSTSGTPRRATPTPRRTPSRPCGRPGRTRASYTSTTSTTPATRTAPRRSSTSTRSPRSTATSGSSAPPCSPVPRTRPNAGRSS